MDNLRIEADEWLIWLDRRFDRRVANERLQTLARFADTVASAQASTKRYSLVEACKASSIDPCRYPIWLFAKLPLATTAGDYAALMRWHMPALRTPWV